MFCLKTRNKYLTYYRITDSACGRIYIGTSYIFQRANQVATGIHGPEPLGHHLNFRTKRKINESIKRFIEQWNELIERWKLHLRCKDWKDAWIGIEMKDFWRLHEEWVELVAGEWHCLENDRDWVWNFRNVSISVYKILFLPPKSSQNPRNLGNRPKSTFPKNENLCTQAYSHLSFKLYKSRHHVHIEIQHFHHRSTQEIIFFHWRHVTKWH